MTSPRGITHILSDAGPVTLTGTFVVTPPSPMRVGTASGGYQPARHPMATTLTLFNPAGRGLNAAAVEALPAGLYPLVCVKDPYGTGNTVTALQTLLDGLSGPMALTPHHEPEADGPANVYCANFVAWADAVEAHKNGHFVDMVPKLLEYSEEHGSNWHDWLTGREAWIGIDLYDNRLTPGRSATAYRDVDDALKLVRAIQDETGKSYGLTELGANLRTNDPSGAAYGRWLADMIGGAAGDGAEMVQVWDGKGSGTIGDLTLAGAAQSAWYGIEAALRW